MADGIASTFSAIAGEYDRALARFSAAGARWLLGLSSPAPGARVLDVGCGSGVLLAAASERVGADGLVVGIDMADGMLDRAREVTADLGNVSVLHMDARRLAFAAGSFDVVTANSVVQFVPDGPPGWARAVAPGGRLAYSFPDQRGDQPWYDLYGEFIDRLDEPARSRYRAARDRPRPSAEAVRDQLGFERVVVRSQRFASRATPEDALARYRAHGSRMFLDALADAARADLEAAYLERAQAMTGEDGMLEVGTDFVFWCFINPR